MPVSESPVVLSGGTKITWAHFTFNPWWGCTVVSPACDHCYAERFAHRLGMDLWQRDGERRFFGDHHWNDPVRWNRKAEKAGVRYRVFCASMADVFEKRDDLNEPRARLWALIEATPHLDWLLLTKRPENIVDMVPDGWVDNCDCLIPILEGAGQHAPSCRCFKEEPWPANAWIGTTVENQRYAELRLPKLVQVPAPVRFISYEPALGPIDLALWIDRVQWVIAGGESGPGARPTHPAWLRSARDQCVTAEVAFHFKQWGEHLAVPVYDDPEMSTGRAFDLPDGGRMAAIIKDPSPGAFRSGAMRPMVPGDVNGHGELLDLDTMALRLGVKKTGRELDGRTWDEFPA